MRLEAPRRGIAGRDQSFPYPGRKTTLIWQPRRILSLRYMKAKIITFIVLLITSVSVFGDSVFVGSVASIVNRGTEAVLVVEPSQYNHIIGGVTPQPYSCLCICKL